jgi:hypothetical protein
MLGFLLFLVFIICGGYFAILYAFGKNKFSPVNLMLTVWLVSIGIAQLRLSPYEDLWGWKFWLLLGIFFILLYISFRLTSSRAEKLISSNESVQISHTSLAWVVFGILSLMSVAANIYIYWRFGTLPLLSSEPDKMRFIINREIFGLWEYLALLPRLYIPLSFIYLLKVDQPTKLVKSILISNIVLGFAVLSLYSSRLVVALPIMLAYFAYLYLKREVITKKRVLAASMTVIVLLMVISVAIPAVRHYITYQDYYLDVEYTPFTYLADLVDADIPDSLEWVVGLYLIPSFNLQAMSRAVDFYTLDNFYWGAYSASVFDSALHAVRLNGFEAMIDWKGLFLPWWVTATFLFSYFVDFGWLGIIVAAILWGAFLAYLYHHSLRRQSLLSVMLLSYFSFVIIMSIYTNYLGREEFYLDIVFIFIVSYLLKQKTTKSGLAV